ncbi:MAG: GTPase Era [bacterium]|nr:GTPase Era [bacterium]
MSFKSGYIALIGRPNVGKSTLLNQLVGETIAIVTPKPQTTRNKILGIRNFPEAQLLFLDTPGLHRPQRDLNEYMVSVAKQGLDDADLVLFLIEPVFPKREELLVYQAVKESKKPYIVILNKIDSVSKDSLIPVLKQCEAEFPEALTYFPISALRNDGCDRLLKEIIKILPEGPAYFGKEVLTDQTERFLAAEIIREQVILSTKQEIPYSVAVTIEEFIEGTPILKIGATIHVEKDSQKGILIGKKGQMLKKVGEYSRKGMEKAFGQKVFLKLFVRVTKDWSGNPVKLKELGYG